MTKGYLILFFGTHEWEWIIGTEEQAHEEATCSNRHLNYGRKGYCVVPCGVNPASNACAVYK